MAKELLKAKNQPKKLGLFCFHESESMIVVGKYTGKTFDGSDSLSMAVMKDLPKFLRYCERVGKTVFFEGDRFTNSNFLRIAKPIVLKIKGDGKEGREERKSSQTERHLKSIKTRVGNIKADVAFDSSGDCLRYIVENC